MLNSVVLPAPFGPITAKISPLRDLASDAIDRDQPAKALRDAGDGEERAHERSSRRRRASHGQMPSGSAITTTSRQTP